MKTNKEVIAKLFDYFLSQNREVVAKMLAATLVDINRFYNLEHLDEEERECLMQRMEHNVNELNAFIKNGPSSDLKLTGIRDE
jgi:hypothetical protein